jgi:hypothetical protein
MLQHAWFVYRVVYKFICEQINHTTGTHSITVLADREGMVRYLKQATHNKEAARECYCSVRSNKQRRS